MIMVRIVLFVVAVGMWCIPSLAQNPPTISPVFFQHDDLITVSYDVTGTSLSGLTDAYIWVWIPGANINAKYNINPASSNTAVTNVVGPNGPKFTKTFPGGRTVFTITFRPSDFFTQNITGFTQIGMLLKGNDWPNGQTSDYLATFWNGQYDVKLTAPTTKPFFVSNGQTITIKAEASGTSDFTLYKDGNPFYSEIGVTSITYDLLVTETSGGAEIKVESTNGANTEDDSFQYLISGPGPEAPRPAGIIPGINYNADLTKVTLCLWAPGKTSAFAFGDFTEWSVDPDYQMYRDGEYFWVELTGLVPGQEYAFQYLVNQTLKLADPYADKILDPDDQYIPATTYPNLKPYPAAARNGEWYYNRLSVFQTNQIPYVWEVNDYQRPPKENLVIYELLIRDLFDEGNRNYQSLIDTIPYLKRLGINAIELMPIMEFNGNTGWGYNPTFMFAPDKYYGTKNKLKELVDVCHGQGIAVILDIALNHQDVPNTYAMLDFDFTSFKPTANNKWFNVEAKHPYNVFFDMNHESTYTQAFVDTVCHYWLHEYRVDGFRFDLSKGFTQKYTGGDVGAWSAYDASRIAIIKRMADKIWSHTADAYIILEHLGENSEERELAQYRSGESKGMLLWGKMTEPYNQNTMGYASNSDISWIYHKTRSWSVPHVVGYMESHDEERLMYKNLEYGNSSDNYNVKDLGTALYRQRTASTMFYTVPGPKMLWQFGELGYDYSINRCENGTIDTDCRLSEKPVAWEYQQEYNRARLFDHTSDLLRLRNTYNIFTSGDLTMQVSSSSLVKQFTLKNSPYTETPSVPDDMNAQVVANFDVMPQSASVSFPHTGTWYEYYTGAEIEVAALPYVDELPAGAYRLYTDVSIANPIITDREETTAVQVAMFPNPASQWVTLNSNEAVQHLVLISLTGQRVLPNRIATNRWDVRDVATGLYVAQYRIGSRDIRSKLFIVR
jgi:1,4-alpha-glucan branching enzyme